MKKFIFLCGMMLLSVNMMAQVDLNDGWEIVLDEQFFGTGREWNDDYTEKRPANIPHDSAWICKWRVDAFESTEGVTKPFHHHAYQISNTLFNNSSLSDDKLRLVAECISSFPLECDGSYPTGYEIPQNSWHHCDTIEKSIFYYSGNIQSFAQTYHFGYYEIECSLPVHPGIHTSFWVWGCHEDPIAGRRYYEEIDIMEYSHHDCDGDPYRGYSSGIWYSNQDISDTAYFPIHYGYKNYHMQNTVSDIRQMHTYACEWMPDHVIFYRDGQVTHEIYDTEYIPQYPKYIKTGYTIDRYALDKAGMPDWLGPDTITINYIKNYRLATDCNTDEYVQNISQLNELNSMKRSITISNPIGITIPSTTVKTLRASDYILIEGPITIPAGAQLTIMVHECPNSSDVSEKQTNL